MSGLICRSIAMRYSAEVRVIPEDRQDQSRVTHSEDSFCRERKVVEDRTSQFTSHLGELCSSVALALMEAAADFQGSLLQPSAILLTGGTNASFSNASLSHVCTPLCTQVQDCCLFPL